MSLLFYIIVYFIITQKLSIEHLRQNSMSLCNLCFTDLGLPLLDKEDDETGKHETGPDDKNESSGQAHSYFIVHLLAVTRNDMVTQDDEFFAIYSASCSQELQFGL